MPAGKSPQLRKDKVIGARFTPHEQAAIDLARGNQPPGTWVGEIVRAELRRLAKRRQDEDQD
jgi:hypothetical protein